MLIVWLRPADVLLTDENKNQQQQYNWYETTTEMWDICFIFKTIRYLMTMLEIIYSLSAKIYTRFMPAVERALQTYWSRCARSFCQNFQCQMERLFPVVPDLRSHWQIKRPTRNWNWNFVYDNFSFQQVELKKYNCSKDRSLETNIAGKISKFDFKWDFGRLWIPKTPLMGFQNVKMQNIIDAATSVKFIKSLLTSLVISRKIGIFCIEEFSCTNFRNFRIGRKQKSVALCYGNNVVILTFWNAYSRSKSENFEWSYRSYRGSKSVKALQSIGHFHYGVILLQLPESFSFLFSRAN